MKNDPVPDSWVTEVEGTWLGRQGKKKQLRMKLNDHVRGKLGRYRNMVGGALLSVSAHTVDALCEDILWLGSNQRWLWCTTAIALTGELILASTCGATFAEAMKEWDAKNDKHAHSDVTALICLRNATCHPAHHDTTASGIPHVERLSAHLATNIESEPMLAEQLRAKWSMLGQQPIAQYALRKLDLAGRAFAVKEHIWNMREAPQRR